MIVVITSSATNHINVAPKADCAKRPASAYFSWFNEKREEFKKQAVAAGDTGFGGPAKIASAAWKAMSDADKAPYEARYQEAKAKHDECKASADYVKPERKQKKGEKPQKDKDAPKRPAGGAYGIFMNEKRAEFTAKAKAAGDNTFGGPAKLASETWKAISETDKASYEEKYQAAKEKYEAAMVEYKASKPQEESSPEKESPAKRAAKRKADGASPPAEKAAKKAGRTAKGKAAAEPVGAALNAEVLKQAEDAGLVSSLKNLAARKEVMDKGCDGSMILKALQAADGLVNKAKAALLGGA